MPRYAAFLRGVSPLNAKMPELVRCFEGAGFTTVKTVLGSGNVVFDAKGTSVSAIQRRAERAMQDALERTFLTTFVRPIDALQALIDEDPFSGFRLSKGSKRVLTFLRTLPSPSPRLPVKMEDARILAVRDGHAFSVYTPGPRDPVFMALIEKTFGKDITTRTWDTVTRVVRVAQG